MKKLTIWRREVTERTKWRSFRYKEVTQFAIYFGGELVAKNSDYTPEDKSIRKPFTKFFETMNRKSLESFIKDYGWRRDADSKFLVENLNKLLEEAK